MNNSNTSKTVKCHKCRYVLLENLKTHVAPCCETCISYNNKNFLFLLEDQLPAWISQKVEAEQWTRGKLHCENCNSKIGSFDFLSGRKCDCGKSVLPPIHLVTSQVDIPVALPNL